MFHTCRHSEDEDWILGLGSQDFILPLCWPLFLRNSESSWFSEPTMLFPGFCSLFPFSEILLTYPSSGFCCCCCWVTSVMSDSVQPHRQQPTRLLCPWDSPDKNTGVGCLFLPPTKSWHRLHIILEAPPGLQEGLGDCSLPSTSFCDGAGALTTLHR